MSDAFLSFFLFFFKAEFPPTLCTRTIQVNLHKVLKHPIKVLRLVVVVDTESKQLETA